MNTRPQVFEAVSAVATEPQPTTYEEMALQYSSPVEVPAESAAGAQDMAPSAAAPGEAIQTPSLTEVYEKAGVRVPAHGFSIVKVAEMLSSSHIQSLPLEAKRASVLMALEASSVGLTDVLEDAARRDRALNEFEARQQKNFQDLKTRKQQQNQQIQAQIESLIEQCRIRIQQNETEVASEKARLDEWRGKKREEERRIRNAASHFGASAAAEADPVAGPAASQRPTAQPELLQMPSAVAKRQAEANGQGGASTGASAVPAAANGAPVKRPSLWRR